MMRNWDEAGVLSMLRSFSSAILLPATHTTRFAVPHE